jgi:hypothetical protein
MYVTIVIAPKPAAPLEMLITYLPADLPAARKSDTLLINPFVALTEKNIPAITKTTMLQSSIVICLLS